MDVDAYLARLGVDRAEPPSVAGLARLHRAHVERVPYETLAFQLGESPSIDPPAAAARVAATGRGGYCFHLNGAFWMLLTALGYDARMHRAGVQGDDESAPGISADHLALTVQGLPDEHAPDGVWMVDVGLGDALYEPVPLRDGTFRQGSLSFTLGSSGLEEGAWRLDHDPAGSFVGVDVSAAEATTNDFRTQHARLSTDPASGFVRTPCVQRRHSAGSDVLRGRTLTRRDGGRVTATTLDGAEEWFGAVRDVFGLPLDELTQSDRNRLWKRASEAHERWLEGR